MVNAQGLQTLMTGSMLDGRDVLELPVQGSADVALAVAVSADERLDAWRLARDLLDETRRWPILTGDFIDSVDLLLGNPAVNGPEPDALRRSQALEVADLIAKDTETYADDRHANWEEIVDLHLGITRKRVSTAPTADEVRAEVVIGDEAGLERWLLAYELRHDPTPRPQIPGYMSWWQPTREEIWLVLPPTDRPEGTLAYIPWYGFVQTSRELAIAAVRSWHERFGAELVSVWGTMLDFDVTRPPQTPDEALAVGIEHVAAAPCTPWLDGMSVRDHARELVGRATWLIHERP